MFNAITFITGLLMVLGICNDTATLTQILICSTLGFALMILSVLLLKQQHQLDFIAPNGRHKTVRINNLLGKLIVTYKYNKLGYKLHTEWEVSR